MIAGLIASGEFIAVVIIRNPLTNTYTTTITITNATSMNSTASTTTTSTAWCGPDYFFRSVSSQVTHMFTCLAV